MRPPGSLPVPILLQLQATAGAVGSSSSWDLLFFFRALLPHLPLLRLLRLLSRRRRMKGGGQLSAAVMPAVGRSRHSPAVTMADEEGQQENAGASAARPPARKRPAFKAPAFVNGAGPPAAAAKKQALGVGPKPRPAAAAARPASTLPRPAAAAAGPAKAAKGEARYFTVRRGQGCLLGRLIWRRGGGSLAQRWLLPLPLQFSSALDARCPAQVLYCKYQPSKKLRKNKSFADGVLEVALETKKAVGAGGGCWRVLQLGAPHTAGAGKPISPICLPPTTPQQTLMDAEGKSVSATTLRGVSVETMGEGAPGCGCCLAVGAGHERRVLVQSGRLPQRLELPATASPSTQQRIALSRLPSPTQAPMWWWAAGRWRWRSRCRLTSFCEWAERQQQREGGRLAGCCLPAAAGAATRAWRYLCRVASPPPLPPLLATRAGAARRS